LLFQNNKYPISIFLLIRWQYTYITRINSGLYIILYLLPIHDHLLSVLLINIHNIRELYRN